MHSLSDNNSAQVLSAEWVILAANGDGDALCNLATILEGDLREASERCVKKMSLLACHAEDVEAESLLALGEVAELYQKEGNKNSFHYYVGIHLEPILLRRCQIFISRDETGAGVSEVFFSEMPKDWDIPDEQNAIQSIEEEAMIQTLLGLLTPDEKAAIRYRYLEDMNIEEAAHALLLSVPQCEKMIQQALQRLRCGVEPR